MLLDGRQLALDGERRLLDLGARHLPLDEAVRQVARLLLQEVHPLTQETILGPQALKLLGLLTMSDGEERSDISI